MKDFSAFVLFVVAAALVLLATSCTYRLPMVQQGVFGREIGDAVMIGEQQEGVVLFRNSSGRTIIVSLFRQDGDRWTPIFERRRVGGNSSSHQFLSLTRGMKLKVVVGDKVEELVVDDEIELVWRYRSSHASASQLVFFFDRRKNSAVTILNSREGRKRIRVTDSRGGVIWETWVSGRSVVCRHIHFPDSLRIREWRWVKDSRGRWHWDWVLLDVIELEE